MKPTVHHVIRTCKVENIVHLGGVDRKRRKRPQRIEIEREAALPLSVSQSEARLA